MRDGRRSWALASGCSLWMDTVPRMNRQKLAPPAGGKRCREWIGRNEINRNAKMNLDHVHPDCREFVAAVEEFLLRRQENALNGLHLDQSPQQDYWGPRTWTRTEMEDMGYSSYKQKRPGRNTRPPPPEGAMDNSHYLDF